MMSTFTTTFGDTATAVSESNNISTHMNTFDSLEYDCWDLIKKYGETLGVKITAEDGIDFYAAKEVQETILNLFSEAGFNIVPE